MATTRVYSYSVVLIGSVRDEGKKPDSDPPLSRTLPSLSTSRMSLTQASWYSLASSNPSSTSLASPALWNALLDLTAGSTTSESPSHLTLAVRPRSAAQVGAKGLGTIVVKVRQAGKADLANLQVRFRSLT